MTIKPNPIADCFGVFQIVVRINQAVTTRNTMGTTGYPQVR